MAKKIRFPLKLAEGAEVRTLEELREHFNLQAILEYYKSGKLLTWLEDRYLEGEAEAVQALDESAADFQRRLCEMFQVEYTGAGVDMEEIERRQERLKRLRAVTDDAECIQNIDSVAFDQEELADLLDEGATKIYLCGDKFTVPASRKGITYVGIKNPAVHISGKVPETAEELDVEFKNICCDNLPRITLHQDGVQNIATSKSLDSKLVELFREISCYDCKYITENYLLFHRGRFPNKIKICRLDLRTLEEIQVPGTDRLTWFDGAYNLVPLGDKLVRTADYSGKIMCLDLDTLGIEYLIDTNRLYDITDQFILKRGIYESAVLVRSSGKMIELHKAYEKIVGDWVYTVRSSPNYRYNPLTAQEEQVQWAGWDFVTEKICGDYIYGTVNGVCSERDLIVLNRVTGEKRTLLHYWDEKSLIKSSNMYQNYWIIADQGLPSDPITIYSVNLETAEVRKIAYFEEDRSKPSYAAKTVDILGLIGKFFYYMSYSDNNGNKLCKIAIDSPGEVIELT